MDSIPQLELDNQLCFALYNASRAMVRAYGPLLGELELTYPQYLTMLVLWEADSPLSVGAIGDRLHLDSSTLTPLLKRLEHLTLLQRERDPSDERRVLITLTEAGRALRERAAQIPFQIAPRFGLDARAAQQLRQSLNNVVDALNGSHPAG
ncbi:MAG: MarR family transcriptional regulator [Antricoccus sp.]